MSLLGQFLRKTVSSLLSYVLCISRVKKREDIYRKEDRQRGPNSNIAYPGRRWDRQRGESKALRVDELALCARNPRRIVMQSFRRV